MDTCEKLTKILDYTGLNPAQFASKIGVKTTQAVYDILKCRTKTFSSSMVDKIISCYPEINKAWLTADLGDMLNVVKKEDVVGTGATPVYDIDATCGTQYRDIIFTEDTIIGHVSLPGISKDSCIVRANGDSMEPKIFDGNMVVIREIKSWQDIFYGQMYLILLDEYRMIKYIRRYEPDEENYIILRSENPKYDDIKLRKDKIRKLFIVENILAIKTQL